MSDSSHDSTQPAGFTEPELAEFISDLMAIQKQFAHEQRGADANRKKKVAELAKRW